VCLHYLAYDSCKLFFAHEHYSPVAARMSANNPAFAPTGTYAKAAYIKRIILE